MIRSVLELLARSELLVEESMKRHLMAVLFLVAATAAATSSSFAADDNAQGSKGGIGFRSGNAPIGVRWWVIPQLGIDLAGGYTSENINYLNTLDQPADETFNSYTVDLGVPLAMKSWESVKLVMRPGFEMTQRDDIDTFLAEASFVNPNKRKITEYSVTAEAELEVLVAKKPSISGSHGSGFTSSKQQDAKRADTSFGTFGSNFTTLGFHVYLG